MSSKLKFVFSILVLVVLVALGWYFVSQKGASKPATTAKEEPISDLFTEGAGTVVAQPDLAQGEKLPAGFPRDIPVEQANVSEGYRAVYNEQKLVQYTVSYTSNKTKEELWNLYNSYAKDSGYAVDTKLSSKSSGQFYANKGSDTLTAVISTRGGASLVQLNLLERE